MEHAQDRADDAGAAEAVAGTVVRVHYANEENGWSVVRLRSRLGVEFTAVGPLLGVREGDRLRLSGSWRQHAKFGEQLEVRSYTVIAPSTLEGIRRFLASGRVRGIGPKMAQRLVERFGLQTLEVIEHEPQRLREVRGVGARTVDKIVSSWVEHRGIQQIVVFLAGHGVSPGIAARLHRRYGASALDVVRSNPYRLAEEVYGVGFLTADRIARSIGMAEDAPERLRAGLVYALDQAALEGHLFLPAGELFRAAGKLLGTIPQDLEPLLSGLAQERKVVLRERPGLPGPAVYSSRLETAEAVTALSLRRLQKAFRAPADTDAERAIAWYQRRAAIELADGQRQALRAALEQGVVVITGGPGTGKTTLVRGLTQILGRRDADVLLAAPTGRAAKRLGEATGVPARTIHRMLEFNPAVRDFLRNREMPLHADCIVVDEVSMLDMELAAHLFEAVPSGCALVLVGDSDQLPSVGPGNVLADLISSGVVPVVRLQEIFRQAEQSRIVVNAHRINHGRMPLAEAGDGLSDFYFVSRDDPAAAADTAVQLAVERIPQRFGFDPVTEVQVLAPMHRGEMGVSALNERLQELLAPPGVELAVGARRFRAGSKVMQVRNNYELDIFNGDIGQVVAVDEEERQLEVDFDGRRVTISRDDLDDLVLAYCCTIHKSQGSEYPAVVVLLHHQHHIMLQRNLLYTAITRGKRLVTVVGSRRALGRAVSNATVRQRYTMLAERLRQLAAAGEGARDDR